MVDDLTIGFDMYFLWILSSCVFVMSNCFFFKQKTAYEMRISDWSSDVCSSDLLVYSPPSSSHAIAGTEIPPTKAAIIRSFRTSLAMTQAPVFYGVAPAYDQWRAYSFRSMASSEL